MIAARLSDHTSLGSTGGCIRGCVWHGAVGRFDKCTILWGKLVEGDVVSCEIDRKLAVVCYINSFCPVSGWLCVSSSSVISGLILAFAQEPS